MSEGSKYDSDYYLNGITTGKSNYENYRWIPEATIPMVQTIIDRCGIEKGSRVLDFGCARGYVVKALRGLGYCAYGYDVSELAIGNCDPEVSDYVTINPNIAFNKAVSYDWVIAKDVLEHVHFVQQVIVDLMSHTKKGLFVVVPLTKFPGGVYVSPEDNKDITHSQKYPLSHWVEMFLRPGWTVEACYRIPGIKDAHAKYTTGTGFIIARRIEE